MGKFKKGDRVRALEDSAYSIKKGTEYTVVDAWDDHIRFRKPDGTTDGWLDKFFELVPAAPATGKFKVGDRVSYSDNKCSGVGVIHADNQPHGWFVKVEERHRDHCPFDDNTTRVFQDNSLRPATLTIREGRFYRTRDGRKVGPATEYRFWDDGYPFEVAFAHWVSASGVSQGDNRDHDLIAEWVDEPANGDVADEIAAQMDELQDWMEGKDPVAVAASNDNEPFVFKDGRFIINDAFRNTEPTITTTALGDAYVAGFRAGLAAATIAA